MGKKWLVYPFTAKDFTHGLAKHGLVKAIDPDNLGEMVTLRVSDRDCDDLNSWLGSVGYREGWVYTIRVVQIGWVDRLVDRLIKKLLKDIPRWERSFRPANRDCRSPSNGSSMTLSKC